MKLSRLLFAFAGTAIVLFAGFTVLQLESQPLKVSTIDQSVYNQYLVNGIPYHRTNVTINSENMTVYFQLVTPDGNLTNNQPFLFEVNTFFVSSQGGSNSVPMNLIVKNFYVNQTNITFEHERNTVLKGKIFQSIYGSVSPSQPITTATLFSASLTVTFYNDFGPYHYQSKTMTFML